MKIAIRLMGMLKEKEPPNNGLEVRDDATIQDVLNALEIDSQGIHVFTVNGSLQRNKQFELSDGDDLTVFPPVGGG